MACGVESHELPNLAPSLQPYGEIFLEFETRMELKVGLQPSFALGARSMDKDPGCGEEHQMMHGAGVENLVLVEAEDA
jgi:hypothetical protein